ncbi:MAG: integrase family protein [Holophaga sp.]|jgi:integrase
MAMKKERKPIRLLKTALEGLEPEQAAYFIAVMNAKGQAVRGLNVRVLPSGKKVFVHRYRFNGFQKVYTLGQFPSMGPEDAEKASRAAQAKIDAGTDPLQAKADARAAAVEAKRAVVTVADLADRFIREHLSNACPDWNDEASRLIKKHILPSVGGLAVAKLGPADVSALLYKMKDTPTQANRTRAVLRTMMGRAEEWEYRPLGSNPVSVIKRRTSEIKRMRRLTDMELKALGAVLQTSKESSTLILALRLALLAGMRKGEVEALRWEWIDLDAGEARIPPDFHKTGRKTGKVRVVHLCSALVADLKATVPTLGCPYVVPGRPRKDKDGNKYWEKTTALQGLWARIRDSAGLAIEGKSTEEDPGLHDLRRTFASVGADLGLRGFVGELLGHAEATVTDIYTRTAAERLHQAAEDIGSRLQGILSGAIDPEKEAEERRRAKEANSARSAGE